MKKIAIALIFFGLSAVGSAQDTLTILQYNLLNYGNNTSYCTQNNNNVSTKDGYIKTIINYVKPDIFSVNEMVASEAMMEHLLGQINTTWTNRYMRPEFVKINSDYLANAIYYNSKKLTFKDQVIVQDYVRDINMFKFYYNSPALEQGDTAFVICIVAHLKAGSGTDNSNKRKVMATNTMAYLSGHNQIANYLMMGDFNLYDDTEPAWQQFTMNSNSNINFNDPINQSGHWHNNYSYRNYHTQSTHADNNGCASYGGMDDRFDYVLISNNIKNGAEHVHYVDGSYWAVGQDGEHFNEGLLDAPNNTSVPSNVLTALGKNSDHLPVTLKLSVDQPVGIDEYKNTSFTNVSFVNPVANKLQLTITSVKPHNATLAVFDFTGKLILRQKSYLPKGKATKTVDVSKLSGGLYIVRLMDEKGISLSRKMLKL